MQSAQTKLKILLAVYQIQNALPWALPYVAYPDAPSRPSWPGCPSSSSTSCASCPCHA